MYVPYFTKNILDYNNKAAEADKFNIKGFLIGNNIFTMSEPMLDSYM